MRDRRRDRWQQRAPPEPAAEKRIFARCAGYRDERTTLLRNLRRAGCEEREDSAREPKRFGRIRRCARARFAELRARGRAESCEFARRVGGIWLTWEERAARVARICARAAAPPRTPPLARACGAVVRTTRAEGSIPASLTCLPRRLECEKTGCRRRRDARRAKALLDASLRRELAGRGRLRASLRRELAGGLRLGPACGANLLGGGGSFEPATAARSQSEWVRQRCKGNESCSRVRRCARARSRHRDVTRRAQRPSRVRLRRRTTFDEQDPVLRLNAGQNRRRARAELAI